MDSSTGFSHNVGGNNAIDYLTKVEGMDFVSAVRLLNEMAPVAVSFQPAKAAPVKPHEPRPFTLPTPDRNAEAVAAYLMHRGISPKVLRYCWGSGICTRPRAATTATAFLWARMKAAFRVLLFSVAAKVPTAVMHRQPKKYGFLMQAENPDCDTVELYEAPIDAMSGATLRQYTDIGKWRSVHYLALGGLNYLPIDYFLQQHPQVKNVVLCFDP